MTDNKSSPRETRETVVQIESPKKDASGKKKSSPAPTPPSNAAPNTVDSPTRNVSTGRP